MVGEVFAGLPLLDHVGEALDVRQVLALAGVGGVAEEAGELPA
ncbi:hypothetical protein ACQP1W_50290 [Spirillospora sp. CA-255316]